MSHCFNFDKMQYPNLPFKYLEVEVDNENIIYPILVRIQEISFGAGVQAQLTGGTYLWQRLFYSFCFTVFCLIWFFTSRQLIFSYVGTGLPVLNQ